MKQVVKDIRGIRVEEVPPPTLRGRGILVRTVASLISAGTERSAIHSASEGYLALARERPDLARQVISHARHNGLIRTYQSIQARRQSAGPLGYSAAGVVTEVAQGVDEFRLGDRAACAGAGWANHAERLLMPCNLAVKLPDSVSFEAAAFSTVGAVAMHGLRLAQPALGSRIAIIGLGLIGQLVMQLARASGCYVIGFDPDRRRVARALELGMECGTDEQGRAALIQAEEFSGGRGVDVVIIAAATPSNQPITLAGEIARQRGEVVVIGTVGMEVPRELFYRKELALRVAMSYGPGRYDPLYEEHGVDYPFAYVRWTERRNLAAFVELLAARRIDVAPLITHRLPAVEAERAYALLESPEAGALGIVLNYPTDEPAARAPAPIIGADTGLRNGISRRLRIGLIGAGVFAKAVMLPALKRMRDVAITAVATSSGIDACKIATALGAAYAITDYRHVLADPEIDAVIALTRDDSHASIVAEALRRGKPIFVEKPLCRDRESLAMLDDEYRQALSRALRNGGRPPLVMVGFNRRFSPHALRLHDELAGRSKPILIQYRVNAGALPASSWMRDRRISAGRLVGEACHFIDLMQFLTGCAPLSLFGEALPVDGPAPAENFLLTIRFDDGSTGSLTYSALGDVSAGKERVEIYCAQRMYVIDDFRMLTVFTDGRRRTLVNRADKGHQRELESFVEAVRSGIAPVPFDSCVTTTLSTFAAGDSIIRRAPVEIADAWPAHPVDEHRNGDQSHGEPME
ncbi:MAG TPA: bi-domain-containing oxidoreductase [Candidatus Binataceae bacterium]|nr:bi-domain-containing oxidoreductase [Candidatus Binataceae bacterium]